MRILLALIFLGHGIAHLPGFLVSWELVVLEPYRTTILVDYFDIGDRGIRVMGAMWLLGFLAFALSSVGVWLRRSWWSRVALLTAIFSMVLCALDWPDAQIGLYINVALIVFLVANNSQEWVE